MSVYYTNKVFIQWVYRLSKLKYLVPFFFEASSTLSKVGFISKLWNMKATELCMLTWLPFLTSNLGKLYFGNKPNHALWMLPLYSYECFLWVKHSQCIHRDSNPMQSMWVSTPLLKINYLMIYDFPNWNIFIFDYQFLETYCLISQDLCF